MIDFASPAPRRARAGRSRRLTLLALSGAGASTTGAERVGLALLSAGGALCVLAASVGMFLLCGFSLPAGNLSFWVVVAAGGALGSSGAIVTMRSQRRSPAHRPGAP